MEKEIDVKAEIARLFAPGMAKKLREGRWNIIYDGWLAGKSFEEMGKHFDRHPSTIKKLLKRAARWKISLGLIAHPVDALGRKICDIATPMPRGERPAAWCHVRARHAVKRRNSPGVTKEVWPNIGYCPVCQQGGHLGFSDDAVLGSSVNEHAMEGQKDDSGSK